MSTDENADPTSMVTGSSRGLNDALHLGPQEKTVSPADCFPCQFDADYILQPVA